MTRSVFFPLAATLGVQVLVSTAALTVPVMAPVAARAIGVSPTLVGVFVALVYGGGMVSSVASGDLVARYGAIRVSQCCLALCAAGLALAALGSGPAMAASGLIIGFGYGPVTPASSHILAKTTPPHLRSFMFSLKQTGVPAGGALAGAMVPPLVLLAGWQQAALAVAAACAVLALVAEPARALLDGDRVPDRRISLGAVLEPLRLVFAYPRIRELALVSFFFSAIQLCLTAYLVTFLTRDFALSLVAAGLVLSVAQGAGIGGRLLWGFLADRFFAARALLAFLGLGMGLASLATALFPHDWPLAALVAVGAAFGATAVGWNGVYLAEVVRLAPEGRAGAATGGALFFTYFGVVLGPPTFGAVVAATGSHGAGYIAFAIPAILGGGFLLAGHLRQPAGSR